MPFIDTNIPDVKIFEPAVFEDERGYFFESFNSEVFKGVHDRPFVQDNQSKSTYGVIRGLHYQVGEYAQAKLVRVLEGIVLDVVVDIRPKSTTYGQHVRVKLSGENKRQLYIPRGFAHGFSVLSPTATFFYKCDNFYCKKSEGGILFNDATLDIDWGVSSKDIQVSIKDQHLPLFQKHRPILL